MLFSILKYHIYWGISFGGFFLTDWSLDDWNIEVWVPTREWFFCIPQFPVPIWNPPKLPTEIVLGRSRGRGDCSLGDQMAGVWNWQTHTHLLSRTGICGAINLFPASWSTRTTLHLCPYIFKLKRRLLRNVNVNVVCAHWSRDVTVTFQGCIRDEWKCYVWTL